MRIYRHLGCAKNWLDDILIAIRALCRAGHNGNRIVVIVAIIIATAIATVESGRRATQIATQQIIVYFGHVDYINFVSERPFLFEIRDAGIDASLLHVPKFGQHARQFDCIERMCPWTLHPLNRSEFGGKTGGSQQKIGTHSKKLFFGGDEGADAPAV